jgi:hypothetical protein
MEYLQIYLTDSESEAEQDVENPGSPGAGEDEVVPEHNLEDLDVIMEVNGFSLNS